MKKVFFSFIFCILAGNILAQWSPVDRCATDQFTKDLYQKYPERAKKALKIDAAIYEQLNALTSTAGKGATVKQLRVVPVVVHIIHNNGPENITNAQVLQGIQDLNDAFRNQNALNTPNGTDTEIEFCLAQRDPNNNATVGITRTVSALTSMIMETDDAALKALILWDPTKYLNIWLVADITSNVSGPGVSGYATMPSSHGALDDGIVNEAFFFGSSIQNSKVHIHEAGHYLGLYHTFEGGCVNNNCLTDGDKVCDTPPDNSTANVTCGSPINTCTTDPNDLSVNNPFRPVANGGIGDQPDMIENHMDYGDVLCHTKFTPGQKNRMQAAITGPRGSLLQSIACTSPCTNPIIAGFTPSATSVTIGSNVNFTNTTTGATAYNWSIGGTSFSTSTNSSNTFNTAGSFWVVLTANNGDPNCQKLDSVLITVNCSAIASFTASATVVNPGSSVTFTNTSTGATTYQWFVDGTLQSTSANFINTFNTVGGFNVYLIACNANCCDTSKYQFISVGVCKSKEANNWYFGYNAGWNFNSGIPLATNVSAMKAEEACASISDKNGNVLMYCDGERLYDKNHSLMQNGMYLWGHKSSSMGALIVPKPGSSTLYYVFTLDAQCGGKNNSYGPPVTTTFPPGALAYHVVDITANGGLGAVILKNQLMYAPSGEKLVGIKHSNGTDIWIVSHDTLDHFYSHLLTCNGLNPTPVISQTGFMHSSVNMGPAANTLGQMMISPNGKKIAVNARVSGTQLGDFNTTTGVVSNMVTIDPPQLQIAHGLAFSPDSKKLYSTAISPGFNGMYQYDVSLGSAAAITASVFQMATNSASVYAGMQLGPDGKIYLAQLNGTSLHVINNPNASGAACSLSMGSVPLAIGTTSRFALPNYLVDYLSPKKASKIQGPTTICSSTTFHINNNCGLGTDSLVWTVNGHSTIVSAVDSAVTISPGASGTDTLISFQYSSCGVVVDTLLIQVGNGTPVSLGNDTVVCGAFSLVLNAGTGYATYSWSTGASTQSITVNSAGTYSVLVTAGTCTFTDTMNVTVNTALPPVSLGPDKTVCPGQVSLLDAGPGYQTYTWQDHSHNQTLTASVAGTYWVTVKDACGNISADTITVVNDLSGSISLGNDTVLCNNQPLLLDPGSGYASYSWSTSSTTQSVSAMTAGTYWVQLTDTAGCSYTDTINIAIGTPPVVSLGNDITVCNFSSLVLNAGIFPGYLWCTAATTQTVTVTSPALYWVEVTDSVGCTARDSMNIVQGAALPNVSLGNDTVFCGPVLLVLNAGAGYSSYSWQNGSTASIFTATATGTYWITTQDTCGNISSDTVVISPTPPAAPVNLGNNAMLCPGDSLVLNAATGYQNYLWQNNSTAQSFVVNNPGTYWVTVQDSCGNSSTDSVQVIGVVAPPPINLGNGTFLCQGDSVVLNAAAGYQTYTWQNNSGGQTQTVTSPGTYWVIATDSCGNTSADTVIVQADNAPAVSIGADKTICEDETIVLDAGAGYANYLWQNGTTDQTLIVSGPGAYHVEVTSLQGCKYGDTMAVQTQDCDTLPCNLVGVPNAFSPNNDLENDCYSLQGWPKCVAEFKIVIFDRWGEKIFVSFDPGFCWDGTYQGNIMGTQVVTYYITGTSKEGEPIHKVGNISLIH